MTMSNEVVPKIIYIRPEYGAESPLWTVTGTMIWIESLPISPSLAERLTQLAFYVDEQSDDQDKEALAAGRELRDELGPTVAVFLHL